jgi:hypothetical protein
MGGSQVSAVKFDRGDYKRTGGKSNYSVIQHVTQHV